MCLMSNAEYADEKNMLVKPKHLSEYREQDCITTEFGGHVPRYIHLAHDANGFGLDGIVIGAPSSTNHISKEEIANIRYYAGDNMLVLLPGVGAQGGEAGKIWEYFAGDRVIVNVGRSLMLPNDSNSDPKIQAETARSYNYMLNSLRAS